MRSDFHHLGAAFATSHRPHQTAVARAAVPRAARVLGAERVLRVLSAAAHGAARRRPRRARAAGSGGERHLDAAAATVPQRPGLGRERLGARPQPRPASRRRGEDAEPARDLVPGLGPQGQSRRLEPGRRLRARDGAPRARPRALRDHARQPVRRRAAREQRVAAVRTRQLPQGRGLARARADEDAAPGAGDGDLQPQRRDRRMAGLPRARRSGNGEHRGRGQPLRARAQPDGAVCDRRSAGAAGRAVEAVRPQRAEEPDLPRSAPRRDGPGLASWATGG